VARRRAGAHVKNNVDKRNGHSGQFGFLRVIDLRLVKDRNDRWRLYVEGVEYETGRPSDYRPAGFVSLAAFLAWSLVRASTPFPPRLWHLIWKNTKPFGAP
jgi:hypothetical protein